MSRKNQAAWTPPAEHAALLPPFSGNEFNGWGEAGLRRPRQIFWLRKPEGHPYARLLEAVKQRFVSVPAYRDVYALVDRGPGKLPPPAENRRVAGADSWTRQVKDFALNRPGARPAGYPGAGSEAELVGIARIDPAWVYEGFESTLPNLIVVGNAMDHARLSRVPSSAEDPEGQLEVCDQYNRGARVVNWLSHWIRAQGYEARPHAGPWVGSLALLPAAIACGFGELGKHGSLINREYGASFRLAAVETDLPLQYDVPDSFGADDFCAGCQVCTNECPPDAISREKVLVRGTVKWAVDFDRCIAYFNETYGCGICLAVCPWSTPGRAPRLAQRFARRAAMKEADTRGAFRVRPERAHATDGSPRQVGAAGELIAR